MHNTAQFSLSSFSAVRWSSQCRCRLSEEKVRTKEIGGNKKSHTLLKCVALCTFLTGSIMASRTTMLISAPEYLQHRNKKHLKNVGPIRYCEPPLHCQSPGVASRTPAIAIAQAACDVHNDDDDNDNAWQRGPLWPHGMGPTILPIVHIAITGNLKW